MTTHGGELRIMACVFCKDTKFHAWMKSLYAAECDDGSEFPVNEDGAKAFILSICGVESRNDLDKSIAAASLFHRNIRQPYLAWKNSQ